MPNATMIVAQITHATAAPLLPQRIIDAALENGVTGLVVLFVLGPIAWLALKHMPKFLERVANYAQEMAQSSTTMSQDLHLMRENQESTSKAQIELLERIDERGQEILTAQHQLADRIDQMQRQEHRT